jgi:hypothetical protein
VLHVCDTRSLARHSARSTSFRSCCLHLASRPVRSKRDSGARISCPSWRLRGGRGPRPAYRQPVARDGRSAIRQEPRLATPRVNGRNTSLLYEQSSGSISCLFLAILISWVVALFVGFGLLTCYNATVLMALFVGAFSVAGAIFLVSRCINPTAG